MEELKQIIFTHWSTILEYICMFVAYFLVFLYRNKVHTTKDNLMTIFKENMQTLKTADADLRKTIRTELDLSKKKYNDAVKKIERLERDLANTRKTIEILLEGNIYEDTGTESKAD